MDETQRAAIFELRGRTPPVAYAKIADQLGIPESQVYREHKRPATTTRNGDSTIPPVPGRHVASDADDPELVAAARRLEVKRLTLQEHELDRRLALLDGKALGQDTAMGSVVALLSEQMRRMEENFDRRIALAQPSKPPEDPMTAMVNGMSMLGKIQQQAQLLAPPAPVSAGGMADLQATVALERVRIESDALTRKATSEAERNAFILGAAKENLPLILAGIQKFLEGMSKRELPEARPVLTVMPGGQTVAESQVSTEIPMTCVSCQSKFMVNPEPGELPTCSLCGGALQPETPPPAPKSAWPEDAIFG